MHKGLILSVGTALSLGLTATTQAQFVMELDTDTDGDVPVTFEFFQTSGDALLSVSWDLAHEAFSPSWGSELRIAVTHADSGMSFTMGGGDDPSVDINFDWADTPGFFSSAGTVSAEDLGLSIENTSGPWLVTVDESFNDAGIDGHVMGTITINKVPAPGALALLGAAGLVSRRRRRRA